MTSNPGMQNTVITYAIVLLVVVRFLFRELRRRKVRVRTVWVRPAILAVLLALLLWPALTLPGANRPFVAIALVAGALAGVVTGALVARSTTFTAAGERGAVFAQGNLVTVVIWLVALALRLLVRFAVAGAGATPAEQLALNVGLVALVTAAFAVVALEFHRAIDRLAQ